MKNSSGRFDIRDFGATRLMVLRRCQRPPLDVAIVVNLDAGQLGSAPPVQKGTGRFHIVLLGAGEAHSLKS